MTTASAAADLSNLTIGLAGPLPPHRAGMGVYVQRLAERLPQCGARLVTMITNPTGQHAAQGVPVYRPRPGRWMAADCMRFALRERVDVLHVHIHGCHWKEMAPLVAVQTLAGVPVVVSQHSMIQSVAGMTSNDRAMLAAVCNRLARVVVSGPSVEAKLREVGTHAASLVQLPPFLPPTAEELSWPDWPAPLAALRTGPGPLIVSGAGRLDAVNGRDLYGLDVFVRAAAQVLARLPDARFAFLLAVPGDAGLLSDAQQFLAARGLADRVVVQMSPMPAPALWQVADVYVRATLDDGDAVSVREALHLGKPVVASDAVGRPTGCLTFRTADADDLARVLLEVAADLPGHRRRVAAHPQLDATAGLADVYRQAVRWRTPLRRIRAAAGRRILARLPDHGDGL